MSSMLIEFYGLGKVVVLPASWIAVYPARLELRGSVE